MSAEPNRLVLGPIVGPSITKETEEIDSLPDGLAVHCSAPILDRLMDHAIEHKHTEVFGLLLGRAVQTPSEKTRTLVLDFLAAEQFASSTLTFVEVSAEELIRLDGIHEASAEKKDLLKVGWFHTHPGHGIFMSSTDKSNHAMYSNPWQIALVLDPIHKTYGFFAGPECKPIALANDVTHSPTKTPASSNGQIATGRAVKDRFTKLLFLLVIVLAITQTLTGVAAARARRHVSELNRMIARQQQRIDTLEIEIRRQSSALTARDGIHDTSSEPEVKRKE